MNPVYTILTPTKIPLGRIDKSINKSFIEESRKFPNEVSNNEFSKVKPCYSPKFLTTLSLHLQKTIQDNFLQPYLFDVLTNLYIDSMNYPHYKKHEINQYAKNIEMSSMWMIEYDENTYFNLHTHVCLPNYYSFSWYLQCEDNRKVVFMSDNKDHEISVSEGDIILFPGWLSHRAMGANSICCSGNFKVDVQTQNG
mgnify:CR=1 FL=1